jgi:hypothetical protein
MKGSNAVCIIIPLLLLPFSGLVAQTRASPFTNTLIVDSVGDFGTQSSLALDSTGNPHISYTYSNETVTNLRYASWAGSEFVTQTVNENGAENPSLALDSEGNPHVCYTLLKMNDTYLMYASKTDSEWKTQVVQFEQNGSDLSSPSLKLDSYGIPHIGYVGPAGCLEYAVWNSSTWVIDAIDPWTERVADPCLALDSNGKPWLSYCDPLVGLKCASWTGSGWNKMIVDSASGVGRDSSLALDSFGNPHISYEDAPNGNLKYAHWTSLAWNIQIVDRNKHVSLHSSLALDSFGNPHISYEDNANGNLVYASWAGSTWNFQVVDQIKVAPGDLEAIWGFRTSLELDATGTAHISYVGYTRHDLKYASISDSPSFLITFKLVGADNFDGKVLQVDSVDLKIDELPKSFVWRTGTNHSFTFTSVLNLNSGGKLFWSSTSGLSTSRSDVLTVSKEGTVSANYEASASNPNSPIIPLNFVLGLAVVGGVVIAVLVVVGMRKKRLKIS